MSRKRKSYTPEFKTKLLLELLEGEKSLNAIAASHYGVLLEILKRHSTATDGSRSCFSGQDSKWDATSTISPLGHR